VKNVDSSEIDDISQFLVFDASGFLVFVEPGIQAYKEKVVLGIEKGKSYEWLTMEGINRFP
jgi:hypothetical protein